MNTETKHTPGPWQAHGCAVYQSDKWKDGNNTGGLYIASTDVYADEAMPTDQQIANAQLIASAPDMAKELAQLRADKRELMALVNRLAGSESHNFTQMQLRVEEARTIITKQ